MRAGSVEEVDGCVRLWTRVIATRDGAAVIPEVQQRARAAFDQPIARFAVIGSGTGSGPTVFALTIATQHRTALLSRLCVDPGATSHGLGSTLLADAVEHAGEAGFVRIDLDVRQTNTRAIALYARAGFAPTSEPWNYDGGDLVVTFSHDLHAHAE